jgi:hypothetical protein
MYVCLYGFLMTCNQVTSYYIFYTCFKYPLYIKRKFKVMANIINNLYCSNGVVIAAYTATFLRSIVLPEFRY